MKAARLNEPGRPLQVENVPEPQLRPGGVKVRVLTASVPSFSAAVLSGQLPIPLPVPYTPGPSCIGLVEQVADDVEGLTEGQEVFCGPHYTSRVSGRPAQEILVGWFGLTPGSEPLMARWKDGAFAERAVYPAACVTPLEPSRGGDWIALAPLSISYGALLQGSFRPGQSLLVNGATGNLGSATVLLALSLGASRVFAVGRDRDRLSDLAALDAKRVIPIVLDEKAESYRSHVESVASGADLVVDALGYVTTPALTLAGLAALRVGGTAVFMGGVLAEIPISYFDVLRMQWTIRGSFMYPASAPHELMRLAASGTLDLGKATTRTFTLGEANQALTAAASSRGLAYCAITP